MRDQLVKIGSGTKKTPIVTLRLIEIRVGKVWRSYLTSVLDPEILPPYVVIDLYQKRWRIEDAFNTVKRLLGLIFCCFRFKAACNPCSTKRCLTLSIYFLRFHPSIQIW